MRRTTLYEVLWWQTPSLSKERRSGKSYGGNSPRDLWSLYEWKDVSQEDHKDRVLLEHDGNWLCGLCEELPCVDTSRLILDHPSRRCLRTYMYISMREYGGVSYLRRVTRIWVDFKDVTKAKWSRHQSLGFFYGVIGYLTLFDFITNPRLKKRPFLDRKSVV